MFLARFAWSKRAVPQARWASLASFVTLQLIAGILAPTNRLQGTVSEVLVTVRLIAGIRAAMQPGAATLEPLVATQTAMGASSFE
ncbi:MAG: hypothetical protein IPM29_24520 [Planctomycetes bacterium]|nr:hypothetical protein [Planctomycetota bacterium]